MSPFLPAKLSLPFTASIDPLTPTLDGRGKIRTASASGSRPSPLGSWVKQILPAHRSERGGTLRLRGYWEHLEIQHPDLYKAAHLLSHRPHGRRNARSRSDSMTGWNMAEDLPAMRFPEEGMDLHHEVTVFDLDAARDETSEADGNVCHLRKSDEANEFKSSALEPELNKISAVSTLRPDSQSYPAAATRVAMSQQQVCSFEQTLEKGDECMRAQGGKPRPAKLDLSKPSRSEKRTPSQESQQKLPSLRSTLRAAKYLYKNAGARSKKDIHQPFPKSGKHKLSRLEKGAEHLQRVNKNTKWRRHRRQWSSAQEPNLSPIPQSVVKTKSATRKHQNRPRAQE